VSFQRKRREGLNVVEPGDVERAEMGYGTRVANLLREFLETIRTASAEYNTRPLPASIRAVASPMPLPAQ
jgi:hypothetical protein